jgi:hypothetical protein
MTNTLPTRFGANPPLNSRVAFQTTLNPALVIKERSPTNGN